MALLSFIALLAGYCSAGAAVAPQETALSFGLIGEESRAITTVLSAIAMGATASVFISMIADRRGRKSLLVLSCVLGGALSSLTAISNTLEMFAVLQFAARAFTVSVFVLAVIIAVEESPPDNRGRTVGRLAFFAALGVPAAALAHSGLDGLGSSSWRGVHAGGVLLVIAGLVASSRLQEPKRWREAKTAKGQGQGIQLIQTAALFFLTYAAALSALGWWQIYATDQRGLSESTVRTLLVGGYGLGVSGYLVGGRIQDTFGRRRTGVTFLALGGLSAVGVFQVGEPALMFPFIALAVFFGAGASAVITTLATEIFVTKLRATSLALNRGVFATLGGITGPLIAGVLSEPGNGFSLAIGDAVSLTSLLYFPALMVLMTLPETRRRNLEDIEASAEIPEPPEEFAYEPPFASRITQPIPLPESPPSIETSPIRPIVTDEPKKDEDESSTYFEFEPDKPEDGGERPGQSSDPTAY